MLLLLLKCESLTVLDLQFEQKVILFDVTVSLILLMEVPAFYVSAMIKIHALFIKPSGCENFAVGFFLIWNTR